MSHLFAKCITVCLQSLLRDTFSLDCTGQSSMKLLYRWLWKSGSNQSNQRGF